MYVCPTYTTLHYTTLQYNTIQYNTIQYNTIQYLLLFYGNNGYANAPQCYVIRTLPLLYFFVPLSKRLRDSFRVSWAEWLIFAANCSPYSANGNVTLDATCTHLWYRVSWYSPKVHTAHTKPHKILLWATFTFCDLETHFNIIFLSFPSDSFPIDLSVNISYAFFLSTPLLCSQPIGTSFISWS